MNILESPARSSILDVEAPAWRPGRGRRAAPLNQIGARLYRQRYVIGMVLLLALVIGALVSWLTPRTYTATASVQLEQQTGQVIAVAELDPQPAPQDADRFLQTQLDHIRSSQMAERVATKLRAATAPVILEALGIEPAGTTTEQRDKVIEALQANLTARLGLNTRMARIAFTSRDPAVSAQVANAYASELVASNLGVKTESSAKAEQYLLSQLGDAKSRLESSERGMLAYARHADLTTPEVAGGNAAQETLRGRQLGALTDSLSQATARRIDAEQRWQQVAGTSAMSLPEVQDNRAVQELVAQRAQLMAQLAEDRQRHTGEYPSVREAEARIGVLNRQIGTLSGEIKRSFQGRFSAAAQQERQLMQTVSGLRVAAASERERGVGYSSLQREVETAKAFYDGLLQRYKEVAAASGAPAANVTLVDRATAPLVASSPDVLRNMGLAGASGLILAMLLGFTRDHTQRVVHSAEDVEEVTNLPALGAIPALSPKKRMQDALADPRSPQSEAYHSVAVALQDLAAGTLPRTLLVTSSTVSEGKSTTALGLARSLSMMGKRVLLVDGDLRHPSLPDLVGAIDGAGFSDALCGSTTPQATIRQLADQEFDVVGAGGAAGSPVQLLTPGKIRHVLTQLSQQHDVVIVDGPPIMGLADAVLLARSVEATVVVVEANKVHTNQLSVAMSRLPSDMLAGFVMTKFDARAAGVSYGDTRYYTY